MRTKLLMLVVAAVAWSGAAVFAQNQTTPSPGTPAITLDKMAAQSSNPLGVDTNVISQLTFDPELPLNTVIQTLANQAKLKVRMAPELMPNGRPGPQLSAAVGEVRYQQMTAFEALVRLARKNDLALGRYADSQDVIIGTKDSKLTPLSETKDLDQGPPGAEFESFADMNTEIPVSTAIWMLAKFANVPILMDPKLKVGGERIVGTNVVVVPPLTNTVNLSSMGTMPARQMLNKIVDVYDLQLQQDPASPIYTVTYKDPGAREPLLPNVIQLRYSNTTNMVELLRSTFGAPTSFRGDTRTASVLVMSTQKDFEAIKRLVEQLDTPTQQVLIEARFLETLQNPKTLKGIDWTDTLAANRFTFGNGTFSGGTTRDTTTRVDDNPTTTPGGGRPVGGAITTTTTDTTRSETTTFDSARVAWNSASGFTPATAFLNAQGVNAVLSFLNTESDTRTLATPRAVTLDNQETRLEVTRAIPIFDASEGIGQGGTAVSSSKPNYTNVGTILIVTPRISQSNVVMRVQPEISIVEDLPSRKVVAGKVNEADIFRTSKIDTQVIIPSGNTLVMGGLVTDSTFKNYTKVPLLGDIPGLGWAFRREGKERRKSNLIIFVTPTIIDSMDFQPYRTEFLNTAMPEHEPLNVKPIDSGKPAKFGKKKAAPSEETATK